MMFRTVRQALQAALASALLLCFWIPAAAEPPLPQFYCPVDEFRHWLSLPQSERKLALATKPEAIRPYLEEKLAEYENLPRDRRETKLQALELRWYMRPLMELEAASRASLIARIPPHHLTTVNERLQQWDLLPEPAKKDMLANEWALQYFARLGRSRGVDAGQMLARLPEAQRSLVQEKLNSLRAMSNERRHAVAQQFESFFELPVQERSKAMHLLSDRERSQMQATLANVDKLPPDQRQACIEGLGKFASMSPEERGRFLRNVERWQSMSTQDRDQWREIVRALPPLPPGLTDSAPPLPLSSVNR